MPNCISNRSPSSARVSFRAEFISARSLFKALVNPSEEVLLLTCSELPLLCCCISQGSLAACPELSDNSSERLSEGNDFSAMVKKEDSER